MHGVFPEETPSSSDNRHVPLLSLNPKPGFKRSCTAQLQRKSQGQLCLEPDEDFSFLHRHGYSLDQLGEISLKYMNWHHSRGSATCQWNPHTCSWMCDSEAMIGRGKCWELTIPQPPSQPPLPALGPNHGSQMVSIGRKQNVRSSQMQFPAPLPL